MQLEMNKAIVRTKGQLLCALENAKEYPGDTIIEIHIGDERVCVYKIYGIHLSCSSGMQASINKSHCSRIDKIKSRVRRISPKELFS